MQILIIEYGLNDTIQIKKKELTLIFYSYTPSNVNFQGLDAHIDFEKKLSQKSGSLEPFLSYLW